MGDYQEARVNQGVLVLEKHVAQPVCVDILTSFHTRGGQPRSYQGRVDPTLRQTDYVALEKQFYELFENFAMGPLVAHFGTPVQLPLSPMPLIYRYSQGVGFCLHHDEVTETERQHSPEIGQPIVEGDYTIVLFLSEPNSYKGGALVFPDYDLHLRPPQGTFVAFPATKEYMHEVTPITSGDRFTVVARVRLEQRSESP